MDRINDYHVIFYFSPEDSAYLALMPDLPGCIADGQTVQEAVKNVRELAKDWIEVTESYNEPIPEPSLQSFPDGANVSIYDVGLYILSRTGKITTKALQKLLYYCKAWSCGWYSKPLFSENFEAWKYGPINRGLFKKHSGMKLIYPEAIASESKFSLSDEQKQFVDQILSAYEDFSADELGSMTHNEDPWNLARNGIPDDARCTEEITERSLINYYGQSL